MRDSQKKGFSLPAGLVVFALAGLVALGGWLAWQWQIQNANRISGKWVEYKNQELGFRLEHPQNYGTPSVQSRPLSKGKTYTIMFSKASARDQGKDITRFVNLTMESQDLIKKFCEAPGKCSEVPAVTSSYIEGQLKTSAIPKVAKGADFYAIVNTGNLGVNNLTIYKRVDLKKIDVSAVQASYAKKAKINDCPKQKFGPEKDGCISKDIYSELNKLVSSIKPL